MLFSVRSHVAPVIALLAAPCSSALAAEPPRVVNTSPAHGAIDVDPETTQLSITFDQKMGPGYSIVGNTNSHPTFVDHPTWDEDQRTFTIEIKLEPGRFYQMQINGAGAKNFQSDPERIPARIHLLAFHTAPVSPDEDPSLKPIDRQANQTALDTLRTALTSDYSHHDRLGIDWNEFVDAITADLLDAPTAYTFAARLSARLSIAQDPHLSVTDGTHVFPTHFTTDTPNFNLRAVGKYVRDLRAVSPVAFAGHVNSEIAYVSVATWDNSRKDQILALLDEITTLAETPAIIFDARPNGGGDENIARQIAARFASRPVVYARHQWRNPESPNGFGPVIDRILEPDPEHPAFAGKVFVLTSPTNMSSNEAFILMMKAAGATIVGEKTYGSSGNPRPIDLRNGVTLNCPAWKAMQPDGTPLEGRGITPDVRVNAPLMTMRSDDPILRKAIELVNDPFKQ